MLETDFILMMTAGFLSAPEKSAENAIADFEGPYALQEIKAPGRVSLGGELTPGSPQPWLPWAEAVRAKGVRGISVEQVPYQREGLAPHIAAAFAGVISFVLQADTAAGRFTWYLKAENSRRTEMTAGQFADFLEIQPHRPVLIDRVHQLINESNELNHRPLVPGTETIAFFHSPAGSELFDFLGDSLLSEIQVECAVNGITLSFPPEWDFCFDPPYGPSVFSSPAGEKEPVYLYSLRAVTAAELTTLIEAQPFSESILPGINEMLRSESPVSPGGATDAGAWLKKGSPDQLQDLSGMVCRFIIDYCQEKEILPVLPDSLAGIFGPDETDQRRARARGHSHTFRVFKPNASSWRYYQFELLPSADFFTPADDREQTEQVFRTSLAAIKAFAEKQRLDWYAGNFRLTEFVLSAEVMNGPFSLEAIAGSAKKMGFGEEYKELLENSIFYVSKLLAMGWPKKKCFGLLAFSLTNIFGGMGSWNDQSFQEDQREYDSVSADFFAAREPLFAAMLSRSPD